MKMRLPSMIMTGARILSRRLQISGGSEPAPVDSALMLRYVARSIDPRGIVVEVGAGSGRGTRRMAERVGLDPSRCYLIEACPENFSRMEAGCPGYRNLNLAVAAQDGSVKLYTVDDPRWDGSSKSNTIYGAALRHKFPGKKVNEIEVPARTLASIYAEHGLDRVEFLWLNCEGAEYQLFGGDNSFLDRTRFVWIELHGAAPILRQFVAEKYRIYDLMMEHGFERAGGHRRDDIGTTFGHLSYLFERPAQS